MYEILKHLKYKILKIIFSRNYTVPKIRRGVRLIQRRQTVEELLATAINIARIVISGA